MKEYLLTLPKLTFWLMSLLEAVRRTACVDLLPSFEVLVISICEPYHPTILLV